MRRRHLLIGPLALGVAAFGALLSGTPQDKPSFGPNNKLQQPEISFPTWHWLSGVLGVIAELAGPGVGLRRHARTREPGALLFSKRPVYQNESQEQRLVSGLKSRSPEAFDELVNRHARRLFAVAMRILRNAQDAEDCVQETFLRAFQSISSFREQSSLSTWLYRIATNRALSKLRKERGIPVVAVEDYLPQFVEGEHATIVRDWRQLPDQALQSRELIAHLERFIAELPEHHRIPYILKDLEELSEAEVSRILGLPKTTIKMRVHRARLVIRSRLEEHLLGPAQPSRQASGFRPPANNPESGAGALNRG